MRLLAGVSSVADFSVANIDVMDMLMRATDELRVLQAGRALFKEGLIEDAQQFFDRAGGKLNDVVLALSSGVVRRYLLERGALPAKSMTAAVPISRSSSSCTA